MDFDTIFKTLVGIVGQERIDLAARGAQDLALRGTRALPEAIKRPIRQGVGRVVTNVAEPFGYVGKPQEVAGRFTPSNLPGTLKSIIRDEPVFTPESYQGDIYRARRPLFREYFDLPTQDVDQVWRRDGKNYRINPVTSNPEAQSTLRAFTNTPKGTRTGSQITGEYMAGYPDPWNFDVPREELAKYKRKPLPLELFSREMFEALGRPAIVQTGGYDSPLLRGRY